MGWRVLETHDTEVAMTTSLNEWHRLHGKVMEYRGLDPDGNKAQEPGVSCGGSSSGG